MGWDQMAVGLVLGVVHRIASAGASDMSLPRATSGS